MFPQFRTVLYKLLQWETAAAFYPADSEGGTGGVWSRGYWGTVSLLTWSKMLPINNYDWVWLHQPLLSFSPVGASSVFQQQDHLWPGWGETQRNHFNTGGFNWSPTALEYDKLKLKNSHMLTCVNDNPAGWGVPKARRCHRSHLPGEARRKNGKSSSLCHVS